MCNIKLSIVPDITKIDVCPIRIFILDSMEQLTVLLFNPSVTFTWSCEVNWPFSSPMLFPVIVPLLHTPLIPSSNRSCRNFISFVAQEKADPSHTVKDDVDLFPTVLHWKVRFWYGQAQVIFAGLVKIFSAVGGHMYKVNTIIHTCYSSL